jgi:hypothetical protein
MKVYYFKKEPIAINIKGRLIKTDTTYHLYLPNFNLEIYGLRHLLPGFYDTEKRSFIVDVRNRDLEKPVSVWEVRKLEEIPPRAIQLEIEEKDIERVIEAYREWEAEGERFTEEVKEILPQLKALRKSTFKTKSKPFEYWEKFSEVVEEIFLKFIDKES